jgi:hypothetical protein
VLASREQISPAQKLLIHTRTVLAQLFYYRVDPNHRFCQAKGDLKTKKGDRPF